MSARHLTAPLLLLLLASASADAKTKRTHEKDFSCPAELDGKTFQTVEFFSGDPSEDAQLAPDNSGAVRPKFQYWTFGLDADPRGLYIVCRYLESAKTETRKLPRNIRSCKVPFLAKTQSLSPKITCR